MSKIFLFAIVGLLVVTGISAHADDKDRTCGQHGDPCSHGCCDGFKCNEVAERCMTIINENTLNDARSKLKHVKANFIGNDGSSDHESCGKHGDLCSQGCCDGFKCNEAADRCMTVINADMLNEAHSKLKPVHSRVVRSYLSASHSGSNTCGKHGDTCSHGCCNGFQCNPAAGRCMTIITADMLKDARSKLKHVQVDQVRGSASHPSPKNAGCGKHGDSCANGCCNGFSCNSQARKCMAIITADMLKDARSKLKPVRSSAVGA